MYLLYQEHDWFRADQMHISEFAVVINKGSIDHYWVNID